MSSAPAFVPAVLKPLCQRLSAVVIEHVDIQPSLPRQSLQRQIAASDEPGNRIVYIVAEEQIKLCVQRIRQEEFYHHLAGAKLRRESPQRVLVAPRWNAESDLFAQVRSELHLSRTALALSRPPAPEAAR